MELKNRIVIISEKNMDALASLYGRCSINELERIVNNIIENAVVEIKEDEGKLHMNNQEMAGEPKCNRCKYATAYDNQKKICYCDNEDRTDEMGKLGMDHIPEISPRWCPLREKVG